MAQAPVTERSLESVLIDRLRSTAEIDDRVRGSVVVDVDDGDVWTLEIEGRRLRLAQGASADADTTISADLETMIAVIGGSMSGVDAFVDGRLRVSGNLALSLRLSGSFPADSRPAHFPRAATVAAGEIDTFFVDAGEGPPIVLLHGLGATNASMLPLVSKLAGVHRVLAPDLPGFGDSGKPFTSYNATFFGRWLIDFLDALGIERAHLVGNSLGGRVAIEGGLLAPERIDRIVLLAPSPAFIRGREFVRLVRILRPELALLPVPLVSRKRVVSSIKAMFSQPQRLPAQWYESAADEFLRVFSTARGRIAFFSAARQIYLEDPFGETGFWDRLPELSRPSLFVWGARDRLVPARFAKHVEQRLPSATSVVLDDCGHVPQYEFPEETNTLIRDFVGA